MKNTQDLQKLHEVLTAQYEELIIARKDSLAKVSTKIAQNASDPLYVQEWLPTWMTNVNYYTETLQTILSKLELIADILY